MAPQTSSATLSESDFYRTHFDSIQALRGISAIFIVLEHVRFLNCGAFGVDIFFCISGFMIMLSTHRDTSHFLGKRLIRILPFYYLMTICTFIAVCLLPDLFAQTRPDPLFLIKSLLFIPFDIGGGVLQPLLRVGWTVNCEIFFYLIFWLAMKLSHRHRGLICGCLLFGVMALAHLLPNAPAPLAFYGAPVMADFLLGILCYHGARAIFKRHITGRLPKFCPAVCVLLAFGCFVGLLTTRNTMGVPDSYRPLLWGIPAAVTVLAFFTAGLFIKTPFPLKRLGDISFSLYLVHYYPVTMLDRLVFDFGSCTPLSLAGTMLALTVSVLLAMAGWAVIEKRLTSWLRGKLLSDHSHKTSH